MQYRLIVEYDGTEFHGWQRQPDARTVQATLEDALARLLGEPTAAAAAGRTDAGVHAVGQAVCFRSARAVPLDTVRRALNALTPPDLTVRAVDTVPDEFDVAAPRGPGATSIGCGPGASRRRSGAATPGTSRGRSTSTACAPARPH